MIKGRASDWVLSEGSQIGTLNKCFPSPVIATIFLMPSAVFLVVDYITATIQVDFRNDFVLISGTAF